MNALKSLMLVSSLCWVGLAMAAEDPLSGSTPLLCAAGKVVVCSESAVCVEGTPEDVGLPRFVSVDLAKQEISGVWPRGTKQVSKVDAVQDLADRLIVQGVDTNIPWSATVDKETGKLVATQSRKYVSFTVFGACMPK